VTRSICLERKARKESNKKKEAIDCLEARRSRVSFLFLNLFVLCVQCHAVWAEMKETKGKTRLDRFIGWYVRSGYQGLIRLITYDGKGV
jgi:hypothetical protein